MFVVPLHLPEVSPVREEPSPWKDVALTTPDTSSLVVGAVVPIPTSPSSLIIKSILFEESLTANSNSSLSGEVSFALSEKAVLTVRLVLLAIAVTVRVSPVTVIRSPTTNSVRKAVPTPVTVVEAAGSMVPARTEAELPLI